MLNEMNKTPCMNTSGNKINIFIAGDSTACDYAHSGENNRYPRTGWGQVFGELFTDDVAIINCALSGRSSKSFLNEENYRFIHDNIRKGDYLFIQFAHNDSKEHDPLRHTSPHDGTYQECIYKLINTARNMGALPILCSSVSRNNLSDTSLVPYAQALKKIASDEDIPLLDIYARTHDYLIQHGEEEMNSLYQNIKPFDERFSDNPEFKNSQYYNVQTNDNTHLNIYGAKWAARFVAEELKRTGHPLAKYLRNTE